MLNFARAEPSTGSFTLSPETRSAPLSGVLPVDRFVGLSPAPTGGTQWSSPLEGLMPPFAVTLSNVAHANDGVRLEMCLALAVGASLVNHDGRALTDFTDRIILEGLPDADMLLAVRFFEDVAATMNSSAASRTRGGVTTEMLVEIAGGRGRRPQVRTWSAAELLSQWSDGVVTTADDALSSLPRVRFLQQLYQTREWATDTPADEISLPLSRLTLYAILRMSLSAANAEHRRRFLEQADRFSAVMESAWQENLRLARVPHTVSLNRISLGPTTTVADVTFARPDYVPTTGVPVVGSGLTQEQEATSKDRQQLRQLGSVMSVTGSDTLLDDETGKVAVEFCSRLHGDSQGTRSVVINVYRGYMSKHHTVLPARNSAAANADLQQAMITMGSGRLSKARTPQGSMKVHVIADMDLSLLRQGAHADAHAAGQYGSQAQWGALNAGLKQAYYATCSTHHAVGSFEGVADRPQSSPTWNDADAWRRSRSVKARFDEAIRRLRIYTANPTSASDITVSYGTSLVYINMKKTMLSDDYLPRRGVEKIVHDPVLKKEFVLGIKDFDEGRSQEFWLHEAELTDTLFQHRWYFDGAYPGMLPLRDNRALMAELPRSLADDANADVTEITLFGVVWYDVMISKWLINLFRDRLAQLLSLDDGGGAEGHPVISEDCQTRVVMAGYVLSVKHEDVDKSLLTYQPDGEWLTQRQESPDHTSGAIYPVAREWTAAVGIQAHCHSIFLPTYVITFIALESPVAAIVIKGRANWGQDPNGPLKSVKSGRTLALEPVNPLAVVGVIPTPRLSTVKLGPSYLPPLTRQVITQALESDSESGLKAREKRMDPSYRIFADPNHPTPGKIGGIIPHYGVDIDEIVHRCRYDRSILGVARKAIDRLVLKYAQAGQKFMGSLSADTGEYGPSPFFHGSLGPFTPQEFLELWGRQDFRDEWYLSHLGVLVGTGDKVFMVVSPQGDRVAWTSPFAANVTFITVDVWCVYALSRHFLTAGSPLQGPANSIPEVLNPISYAQVKDQTIHPRIGTMLSAYTPLSAFAQVFGLGFETQGKLGNWCQTPFGRAPPTGKSERSERVFSVATGPTVLWDSSENATKRKTVMQLASHEHLLVGPDGTVYSLSAMIRAICERFSRAERKHRIVVIAHPLVSLLVARDDAGSFTVRIVAELRPSRVARTSHAERQVTSQRGLHFSQAMRYNSDQFGALTDFYTEEGLNNYVTLALATGHGHSATFQRKIANRRL